MQRFVTVGLLLNLFLHSSAFAGNGKKEVLTLSKGKYVEVFDQDSIEHIGNIVFNVNTQQIIGIDTDLEATNAEAMKPEIISRWLSPDPLAEKYPNLSPYVFCENNPILNYDPDGRLSINYTQKDLAAVGLTQAQMTRFETIMRNLPDLFVSNTQAMEALRNTTGFTNEQIQRDLTFGNGPGIKIQPIGGGASSTRAGIVFDPGIIKNLAGIDPNNKEALAYFVLGTALTMGHEWAHYADEITNGGHKTGEWIHKADGVGLVHTMPDGTQTYKFSPMGHRGTDVEAIGFGLRIDVKSDNTFKISNVKNYELGIGIKNLPPIPQTLPENINGINILKTLNVQ